MDIILHMHVSLSLSALSAPSLVSLEEPLYSVMLSLYRKPLMQIISITREFLYNLEAWKDKQQSPDLAESSFCGRRIQTFEKF